MQSGEFSAPRVLLDFPFSAVFFPFLPNICESFGIPRENDRLFFRLFFNMFFNCINRGTILSGCRKLFYGLPVNFFPSARKYFTVCLISYLPPASVELDFNKPHTLQFLQSFGNRWPGNFVFFLDCLVGFVEGFPFSREGVNFSEQGFLCEAEFLV